MRVPPWREYVREIGTLSLAASLLLLMGIWIDDGIYRPSTDLRPFSWAMRGAVVLIIRDSQPVPNQVILNSDDVLVREGINEHFSAAGVLPTSMRMDLTALVTTWCTQGIPSFADAPAADAVIVMYSCGGFKPKVTIPRADLPPVIRTILTTAPPLP